MTTTQDPSHTETLQQRHERELERSQQRIEQQLSDAYEAIDRRRNDVLEAHENGDADELRRALADYTRYLLRGVGTFQNPLWGQTYIHPEHLAEDLFDDDSLTQQQRVEHARRLMTAAEEKLRAQQVKSLGLS